MDSPADHAAPYAVLDLGGGSTQIVFEPENVESKEAALKDGEHKAPTSIVVMPFWSFRHAHGCANRYFIHQSF